MVKLKKVGIDIRSGNWLFYDNHLLNVAECKPKEFGGILRLGHDAIIAAALSEYDKTVARFPEGARIFHPPIRAIRLTGYDDAFTHGLVPEAEMITPETHSDDDYHSELVRREHWPYLDEAAEAGFATIITGRWRGWDQQHDGLWIQVQEDEIYKIEHASTYRHTSPGDSTVWPTTTEEEAAKKTDRRD